ncbi:MAG: response regulator [bacterium]|nr:response regulator [bacterium]
MRLKNLPIRYKLMVIIMVTTVLGLLLASIAFLCRSYADFDEWTGDGIKALAATLDGRVITALGFEDSEERTSIPADLRQHPEIVGVRIVKQGGEVICDQAWGEDGAAPGDIFQDPSRTVTRPVVHQGKTVGSLIIAYQTRREDWFSKSVIFLGLVLLGVPGVAFLVSAALQGLVSKPILDLVQVVRRVSDEKDYKVRVPQERHDELGRLIAGFNDMLAQIERREADLRVARDHAEHANRAKSVFLANMSHELRTPLTVIIGFSEVLIEDAHDQGLTELLPDLRKIHTAGKQLLDLINSILDLSKVEAGRMDLMPERFEVRALLDELRPLALALIENSGNTLEVQCEAVGEVLSDRAKIRQILLNLLSNAAKFTDAGRVVLDVVLRSGEDLDYLVLQVADSGIGMSPEQQQRLFEPFTQAAETGRGGTGLGLALCKRFAELMEGKIEVESKLGKGSRFTVTLPANLISARQNERSVHQLLATGELPSAVVEDPGAGAPLVLVIDDDLAVQDLLRDLLGREGYRLATAGDGEEGLRLARELRPATIILDVIMPQEDGWAVLNALKSDPELAAIPVIIASVLDDEKKGYALGADDYLTKPMDRRRLADLLHRFGGHHTTPSALVVDDDPNFRKLLSDILREQNWQVDQAEDGIAALRRLAHQPPTLILTGLMMPRMDGFDFVAQLRKNAAWQHIPIIVLTAKELGDEELQRLDGCVQKVLEKGIYNLEELMTEIRTLTRRLIAEAEDKHAA